MILWGKSFAQKRKRGRRKKCESALWRLKFNESEWWLYALDQVSLLCLFTHFFIGISFSGSEKHFRDWRKVFWEIFFFNFLAGCWSLLWNHSDSNKKPRNTFTALLQFNSFPFEEIFSFKKCQVFIFCLTLVFLLSEGDFIYTA